MERRSFLTRLAAALTFPVSLWGQRSSRGRVTPLGGETNKERFERLYLRPFRDYEIEEVDLGPGATILSGETPEPIRLMAQPEEVWEMLQRVQRGEAVFFEEEE